MRLLSTLVLLFLATNSHSSSGPTYVAGPISNITSVNGALLIKVGNNELPQNCTTSSTWMQITEDKEAIVALTITAWTLGRNVVVYTNAGSTGYCHVNQVDPAES